MRTRSTTRRPVLERLVLPELGAREADELRAEDTHDAVRVTGGDVSGRDLTGTTFTECELDGVTAHETSLSSARLIETRIERLNAPVLRATRSTWRHVEMAGSRLGALDLDDAEVRQVHIVGSKIGWLNLRAATLEDVLLEDCTLEELDLTGASAARVAFVNCRAGSVALAHARLQDVDLRGLEMGGISNIEGMAGATLDAQQVAMLAPAFASHLGVRIED